MSIDDVGRAALPESHSDLLRTILVEGVDVGPRNQAGEASGTGSATPSLSKGSGGNDHLHTELIGLGDDYGDRRIAALQSDQGAGVEDEPFPNALVSSLRAHPRASSLIGPYSASQSSIALCTA